MELEAKAVKEAKLAFLKEKLDWVKELHGAVEKSLDGFVGELEKKYQGHIKTIQGSSNVNLTITHDQTSYK
jgi:hypothetical protein